MSEPLTPEEALARIRDATTDNVPKEWSREVIHDLADAALAATPTPAASDHVAEGNEGYCRCGYFGGGREHRDLADHLAATDIFAPPLPELGCDCSACTYLSKKQAER